MDIESINRNLSEGKIDTKEMFPHQKNDLLRKKNSFKYYVKFENVLKKNEFLQGDYDV